MDGELEFDLYSIKKAKNKKDNKISPFNYSLI